MLLTKEQDDKYVKNTIGYILFETEDFASIESHFLTSISKNLPNRKKLMIVLKKIARLTQKEINSQLVLLASNYLTFDEWTDSKQRKFLGITIRAFIEENYKDFFWTSYI